VERGEELAYGMDECAGYPLFTEALLDVMRQTIPRERWGRVARSVIFTARRPDTRLPGGAQEPAAAKGVAPSDGSATGLPSADAVVDVGSAGCEEGVLLRLRNLIVGLATGQVIEVRSTDPGVREDLPAWCRLTGNEFLTAAGARYFVRKR
jgi:TusA-related sulfurtransferase